MNTNEFKNMWDINTGYDISKITPDWIDISVVNEWVDGRNVISFKRNDNNFLLTCIEKDDDEFSYSFLRFFNIGDNNTQCSVDFEAWSYKEAFRKLTEILEDRHTF